GRAAAAGGRAGARSATGGRGSFGRPRGGRMNATERIRTVLVDDEPLARQLLREYLSVHHDVDIVAECENGFDAIKAVAEQSPDLLFLDIQMPKLDGFEVLELLDRDLAVIFVTAYDQHAVRAFEVHA